MKFFGKIEAQDPESNRVSKGAQLPDTGNDGDLFALILPGDDELYIRKEGAWLQLIIADGAGKVPDTKLPNIVSSVFGRTGVVQMQGLDVVTALGYTPSPAGVLQALTSQVSAVSGTTTKTDANTTPVSTNGTQIWSQDITPGFTTSRILINGAIIVDHGTNGRSVRLGIFRGTTCIGVVGTVITTAGQFRPLEVSIVDSPATTSATTYSIRCWGGGTGTWYIGQATTALFNGMLAKSTLTVSELA